MLLHLSGQGPLYRQLYDACKHSILTGILKPAERLPSSRELSEQLNCSRNTVVNAYEQLICEGFLESRKGQGTFICDLALSSSMPSKTKQAKNLNTLKLSPQATHIHEQASYYLNRFRHRPKYDFKYGDVKLDEKSLKQWQRILKKHANSFTQEYDQVQGDSNLRHAIADHLRISRGVYCDASQVFITSGSQQALNMIARLFVNPGDIVITEDPCYLGSTLAFETAQASIHRIAVDEEGLDIEQYQGNTPKLLYLTPSHQYPTGVVMSARRRMKVIEWAHLNNVIIIEDDYDSEFRYEGKPVASIQSMDNYRQTLYVGTFSKSLYPALRIGYIVAPEILCDYLAAWKWNEDRHCSSFVQPVLAEFISQGYFARHIKRMRNNYAEKRLQLKYSLNKHLGSGQTQSSAPAGLHVLTWLQNTNNRDIDALLNDALQKNLGIYPANYLYKEPPKEIGLVMGFTPLPLQQIDQGVQLLSKLAANYNK